MINSCKIIKYPNWLKIIENDDDDDENDKLIKNN